MGLPLFWVVNSVYLGSKIKVATSESLNFWYNLSLWAAIISLIAFAVWVAIVQYKWKYFVNFMVWIPENKKSLW